MIKTLVICLVFISSLTARENPFFPSTDKMDIPFSTNKNIPIEPLKRATLTLPSTARILESVTITYKNLDGSIVSHKEILGNRVDWHLPIFISQNIGGEEKKKKPKLIRKKNENFTKILSMPFVSLYVNRQNLKIITKDKMLRNFLLTKPHRIVCDFEGNVNIRSYEKVPNVNTIVEKIRLGNHKNYYRIVIELDGHYKYKLKKSTNTYNFLLL